MMGTKTSDKHKWTSLDGTKIETPSIFQPFKGIILEEENKQAKVVIFVLKDEYVMDML